MAGLLGGAQSRWRSFSALLLSLPLAHLALTLQGLGPERYFFTSLGEGALRFGEVPSTVRGRGRGIMKWGQHDTKSIALAWVSPFRWGDLRKGIMERSTPYSPYGRMKFSCLLGQRLGSVGAFYYLANTLPGMHMRICRMTHSLH